MARFIVRADMEGATPTDYEKLATRLYKRKIYQVIANLEGVYYDLPPATYISDYYSNPTNFFEIARNTVLAVINQYDPPKKYEIVVFEYVGSMFVLNENTDTSKLPK